MQNGEIYNYWDLKPELEKKYKFISGSDSEIVGMLYKEVFNSFYFLAWTI
jgi:asparagine synthase (glutamine-hydrolysing)